MKELSEISHLINTQDNLGTADPIFIVQKKTKVYGLQVDDADDYIWMDTEDWGEVDEEESKRLDQLADDGSSIPTNRQKYYYICLWEFVTACFTRKACKDYIRINGHNLEGKENCRIFVCSAFRNYEWQKVRNYLKDINKIESLKLKTLNNHIK